MARDSRRRWVPALLVAGCVALAHLGAGAACCLAATTNLREDFSTDPDLNPGWRVQGSFVWSGPAGILRADCATQPAAAWWVADQWGAGALSATVRLAGGTAGEPPELLLAFARNPATKAYRWVRITGGEGGGVAVGQSGVIDGEGAGVFRSVRAAIPLQTWIQVLVAIDADGRVRVAVSGEPVLRARVGSQPAAGRVGIVALRGKAVVTEFGMRDERPAGCGGCHDGSNPDPEYPLAPDVYRYWDGTWWDATQGGLPSVQQGGHGDPGGNAANGCTDCHDLTTAAAQAAHLDGVVGGRGAATPNTYHLKPEFFTKYPGNDPSGEYGLQVAFDNYCAFQCHAGQWVRDMRHENDTVRTDPGYRAVQLGTHLTMAASPALMDSDLSSDVAGGTNFSPCVGCHDPHGSGTTGGAARNYMVRAAWTNPPDLCASCHQ
jgi:predicted CXXCH cytochrome family protein